jgi:hypothetical protein
VHNGARFERIIIKPTGAAAPSLCAVVSAEVPDGLLSILPYDRCCRLQPNAEIAALVNKGTPGGNAPDDILGGQYRRHFAATLTRRFASNAIVGVKRF